mgnify:FL=1
MDTEAASLGVELPAAVMQAQVFKVWPENWQSVVMFLRLETQWRQGPRGPTGLDLSVAQWMFSLYEIANPLAVLEDLRTMESAFLQELYS